MSRPPLIVGIDLGTTNSSVGVYRNGNVEIIPNEEGQRTTPSFVAFTDTERLFGAAAKNQAARNAQNTVFNAKLLVGPKFLEDGVQAFSRRVPFDVVSWRDRPAVQVEFKGERKTFTPEAILSMVLVKMKAIAETYLGETVEDIVVTVPASFNMSQRQSMRTAGLIAGLKVHRTISSPAAVAIAYGRLFGPKLRTDDGVGRTVLVYNLGGGFCSVAIIEVTPWDDDVHIEVKAVSGDTTFAGEAFTDRMVQQLAFDIHRKSEHKVTNSRAHYRLRAACERAKCTLSSSNSASIEIESLFEGFDFYTDITRARFEDLCEDLFRSSLLLIERVLRDAKLRRSSIDEIVLSGGSSRIPKFRELITGFFVGRKLNLSLNPDEAACCGAATQAANLSCSPLHRVDNFLLQDVIPLTLGIETSGGRMSTIISRNTTTPIKMSRICYLAYDGKKPPAIKIYEGERHMAKDNNLLGIFQLENLQLSGPLEIKIDLAMSIGLDDVISVYARDMSSGVSNSRHFYPSDYDFLGDHIVYMLSEELKYKAEDDAEFERIAAGTALETETYAILELINGSEKLGGSDKVGFTAEVHRILTWLDDNKYACKDEYEVEHEQLRLLSTLIATRLEDLGSALHKAKRVPSADKSTVSDTTGSDSKQPREASLGSAFQNLFSSVEQKLGGFFSGTDGSLKTSYTDSEMKQISDLLLDAGRPSWSKTPRIYTVLRKIGQLQLLDSFIDLGLTDIWFPFTLASLPQTLTPSMASDFLKNQSLVFTKSLRFENGTANNHAHFAQDEPLPFEARGSLGSGRSSKVDRVVSILSGREFARKRFRRIRPSSQDREDIKIFMNELKVLKRIRHLHCVELIGSYTDPRYFGLIMAPVADCDMGAYYSLVADSAERKTLLRTFFGCLTDALRYLHDSKIRHRDIKPQNILVKGDCVYLSDFGISLDWENLPGSTTTADSGKTWVYAAPEVAQYQGRNSSSDIWSLGCVFLEMTTVLKNETVVSMRNFLRQNGDDYRFYGNIPAVRGWIEKLAEITPLSDSTPLIWVARMLQQDPASRPTASDLFDTIQRVDQTEGVSFCGACCIGGKEGSDAHTTDDEDMPMDDEDGTVRAS